MFDRLVGMSMERRAREILDELEATKCRLLSELTDVDKETLGKLRTIVEDYYNAENRVAEILHEYNHKATLEMSDYVNELRKISADFKGQIDAYCHSYEVDQQLRAIADEVFIDQAEGAFDVVQETGNNTLKVMSQDASTRTFAHAIVKTEQGKRVNVADCVEDANVVHAFVEGVDEPATVTVDVCGKNLLIPNSVVMASNGVQLKSGITMTFNGDGSVTFNGTATMRDNFYIVFRIDNCFVGNEQYTFSIGNRIPDTGGFLAQIDGYLPNNNTSVSDIVLAYIHKDSAETITFTPDKCYKIDLRFTIPEGGVLNNYTIYPQIECGGVATEYEPYWRKRCEVSSVGEISGIPSVPNFSIISDSNMATIKVTYHKDLEKYFKGEIKDPVDNEDSGFDFSNLGLPIVYLDGGVESMTKDNAVQLNYRFNGRMGTCEVKWQGSSSVAYPKKNYTVKFDTSFEVKDGWGEHKKYCLKADWVDFSHCRNVVSAKLWGDIVRSREESELVTRLKTLPNCGAVDGFPCFVVINGEWQGVYNFNIPKDDYMLGMGEGSNEAILCADNPSGSGCRWWATPTIGSDYEVEYVTDEDNIGLISQSIENMYNNCRGRNAGNIDDAFVLLDKDSTIDYFIFTALTYNTDGIGKNHLLCTYDGVKWFFTAYDLDSTWGIYPDGKQFHRLESVEGGSFSKMATRHKAFDLIYTYKKHDLISRYKELRKGVMSVMDVMAKFYNYANTIPMQAKIAECGKWRTIPSASVNDVNQIVTWYMARINILDKEIEELEKTL